MTYRTQQSDHGFTLVELILVMAIIAIVATQVVVSLNGRQRWHGLQIVGSDLTTAVYQARSHMQQSGRPTRVHFAADSGWFRIEDRAAGVVTDYTPLPGRPGQPSRLAEGVSLRQIVPDSGNQMDLPGTDGPSDLVFLAPDQGFSGRVEFQDTDGDLLIVTVLRGSAQVNLQAIRAGGGPPPMIKQSPQAIRQQGTRGNASRAMTLLEVLVALSILAIGIVGVLGAVSMAWRTSVGTRRFDAALTVAQEQLAVACKVRADQLNDNAGTQGDVQFQVHFLPRPAALVLAEVVVNWSDRGYKRELQLHRLFRPQEPPSADKEDPS